MATRKKSSWRSILYSKTVTQALFVLACVALALQGLYAVKRFLAVEIDIQPALEAPALLPPLWYHAPFFAGNDYGAEATVLTLGLMKVFPVLSLSHWGNRESFEVLAAMDSNALESMLKKLVFDRERSEVDRKSLVVCQGHPGALAVPEPLNGFGGPPCPPWPVEQATYVIGRFFWSGEPLIPEEVHQCNQVHEIWVPSNHMREALKSSGVVRPHIEVVPEAVQTDVFYSDKHKPLPWPIGELAFGQSVGMEQPFVFVSVFDWVDRSGWDVLLRAYLEEFSRNDNVALILHPKPSSLRSHPDYVTILREWATIESVDGSSGNVDFHMLPHVSVVRKYMPDLEMARLYKAANAFVLSTRGEGSERAHVEAMSMGLPVIATDSGASAHYLDASVGYLIGVEGLVPVPQLLAAYSVYEGELQWLQPSVRHLRQLLRYAVEHPAEVAAKGKAARARVEERYAADVVAKQVAARLQMIFKQVLIGNATAHWRSVALAPTAQVESDSVFDFDDL